MWWPADGQDNHATSTGHSSGGREWAEAGQPQEEPIQTNTTGLEEPTRAEPGSTVGLLDLCSELGWQGGPRGVELVPLAGFLALPRLTGKLSAIYW